MIVVFQLLSSLAHIPGFRVGNIESLKRTGKHSFRFSNPFGSDNKIGHILVWWNLLPEVTFQLLKRFSTPGFYWSGTICLMLLTVQILFCPEDDKSNLLSLLRTLEKIHCSSIPLRVIKHERVWGQISHKSYVIIVYIGVNTGTTNLS